MSGHQITPAALKMAWKMLRTIFPQYSVPQKDADQLLMAVTIMALEDLRRRQVVEWRKPLLPKTVIVFRERSVKRREATEAPVVLKQDYSQQEIDLMAELAEEIFIACHLPEIEIATLYTALPCLGLHAIQDHLTWNKAPPFPELGSG